MNTVTIIKDGITFKVPMDKAFEFASALNGKSDSKGAAPKYLQESDINAIQATSAEELVLKAIDLSKEKTGRGVHSTYSGLNARIKMSFGKEGRQVTEGLKSAGKIQITLIKGGVILERVEAKK